MKNVKSPYHDDLTVTRLGEPDNPLVVRADESEDDEDISKEEMDAYFANLSRILGIDITAEDFE